MRPPDWRHSVALHALITGERTPGIIKDRDLSQFIRMLQDQRQDGIRPDVLARRYPSVYLANMLHFQTGYGSLRWFLEALVMGRCPSPKIARLLELGPKGADIVRVYKRLFFDVKGILDNSSAVYSQILAVPYQNTTGADDCDFMWKSLAYGWGWADFHELIHSHVQSRPLRNRTLTKRFIEWQKRRMLHVSAGAINNFQRRNIQQNLLLVDKGKDLLAISTEELDKSTGDRPEQAAKMVLSALQTALTDRPPPPPPDFNMAVETRLNLDYLNN
jgi:hypothetical protein